MSRMRARRGAACLQIAILSMFLIGGLFAGAPETAGAQKKPDKKMPSSVYEELRTFTEVLSYLKKNYVENVEDHKLVYGAVRGMLRTLDPHTTFLPPEVFRESQVETRGKFGGLGIEITIRQGVLTVISPIDGTPAQRAGLKSGDRILKVDGEATKDMTLFDAVKKLRGKPNSKVTLSIIRAGWATPRDFTLTREVIRIKTVSHRKLGEGLGYLQVRQFTQETGQDVKKGLDSLGGASLKGLVLDLRNNPGGLLSAAVAVTDHFVSEGALLVYTKGRDPSQNMRFHSRGENAPLKFPMVILVNGGSASASEIVAGALQDMGRAVIAGTSTFGKGSVQTIIPLSDGSGLRMTTGRYYTPNGRQIQGRGIMPDIVVEVSRAPTTKKRRRLKESDLKGTLKGEDDPESTPGIASPRNGPRNPLKKTGDSQLDRAVELRWSWDIFRRALNKGAETG